MKKKLKQYRDLLREKRDLKGRIRRETALIEQSNAGVRAHTAYRQKLTEEQAECEAAIIEIEEYIKAVPDPLVRMAMRHRYIDGLSWVKTALQIGGGNTADSCRMAVDRYLRELEGQDEVNRCGQAPGTVPGTDGLEGYRADDVSHLRDLESD